MLSGKLVQGGTSELARAQSVRIVECELQGVAFAAAGAPGLRLIDALLRDCDLSNVDGREGSLRRVAVVGSRLVGFGLTGGHARDLRITDSSLRLASFAFAELRDVIFERVDLSEASFMGARLENVEFRQCGIAGADFRQATLRSCAIRGAPLDGVLGVECMRGLEMPWPDVLSSARSLADALGIVVEPD